jgi:hypothetical protein
VVRITIVLTYLILRQFTNFDVSSKPCVFLFVPLLHEDQYFGNIADIAGSFVEDICHSAIQAVLFRRRRREMMIDETPIVIFFATSGRSRQIHVFRAGDHSM